MRIVHFEKGGVPGIAADDGSGWHGLTERESGFPGTLPELIAQGADLLRTGRDLLPMHAIDLNAVRILAPVPKPPKILCVGLAIGGVLLSDLQRYLGKIATEIRTSRRTVV